MCGSTGQSKKNGLRITKVYKFSDYHTLTLSLSELYQVPRSQVQVKVLGNTCNDKHLYAINVHGWINDSEFFSWKVIAQCTQSIGDESFQAKN